MILELDHVSKQYGALRPLRLERLAIDEGEPVTILGLDQPAAEVFINLATGASLPDTGTVSLFGRSTASIADSTEWLTTLDRFGIVSERAALLDSLSVLQNLAMPFSLDIEPMPDDLRGSASTLAREVGLPETIWDRPVAELSRASLVLVRLARALALVPALLLIEHPTAGVPREDVAGLARQIGAIVERRRVAAITLTMDADFARALPGRRLTLAPATGDLKEERLSKITSWWRRN